MLSGTIVRGTPAGPYTTARRLAGRTRPEIKQVHRFRGGRRARGLVVVTCGYFTLAL